MQIYAGTYLEADQITADQYTELDMQIRVTNRGERVVEDRELTLQYIYNLYYW